MLKPLPTWSTSIVSLWETITSWLAALCSHSCSNCFELPETITIPLQFCFSFVRLSTIIFEPVAMFELIWIDSKLMYTLCNQKIIFVREWFCKFHSPIFDIPSRSSAWWAGMYALQARWTSCPLSSATHKVWTRLALFWRNYIITLLSYCCGYSFVPVFYCRLALDFRLWHKSTRSRFKQALCNI